MVVGCERLLLIDLENSVGGSRPRPTVLRSRVGALLAAAGAVHHAVAGYATDDLLDDPTASALAQLGVAPLRVPPAPDAAELVLLAHARRTHDSLGCRSFLVASADRRFAELADLGRLELLAWEGQPIAAKLEDAAHVVHRIARPTPASAEIPEIRAVRADEAHAQSMGRGVVYPVLLAMATGVGIGAGHRAVDALLRRR